MRPLACLLLLLVALPARALDLSTEEVAPGVHVAWGVVAEAEPHNHGAIANLGFIVGERCVAVIDSGGTLALGRALKAAVARVTALPVCYVINSHVHPDHIFGNAAFRGPGVEFVGHARLPVAMATRGAIYLKALDRILDGEAAGSEIVPPTLTVDGERSLDLGGRVIKVRAWPTAHTDNDLTVEDSKTGVLWLSDLLFVDHMPALDGSARGWLKALAEIARHPAPLVIPGHGRAGADWRGRVADQARYLEALVAGVRQAIKAGRTISQATGSVAPEEIGRWALAEAFHRRNITAAYAELEWED